MNFYIAPIVEGHHRVESVKRLLQRIWTEFNCSSNASAE